MQNTNYTNTHNSRVATSNLEISKSNRSNMTDTTKYYLPNDDRGHILASSLGGQNLECNIVPQNKDVNRYSYRDIERGETKALKNGCDIQSEKIAYYSDSSLQRPNAFMVNDIVTYPNGSSQEIHSSFANMSFKEQELYNQESKELLETISSEFANPEDMLRYQFSSKEYADIMEESDAQMPELREDYEQASYAEFESDSTGTE